jgi:hypothetical protein
MMARRPLVVLLIVVVIVGAFFVGRASVSPKAAPPATGRTSSGVAADFSPISVSFASLNAAWSLGTGSCSSIYHCLELIRTSNLGRSWTKETLPASLLKTADRNFDGAPAAVYGAADLNVRFANSRDGWVFGFVPGRVPSGGLPFVQYQSVLWSTHNGGRSWQQVKLRGMRPQDEIFDLETSRGEVYVLFENNSYGVTVDSSPVGIDAWRKTNTGTMFLPAGGGQPTGSIVLEGTAGWLVAGNDRGVSGSARLVNGSWVPWTPPCYSVGNSYVVPAASNTKDLTVICAMGGFASPLSKSAPPGAKYGSNWLYFSTNSGQAFAAGPELSSQQNYYFFSEIASPSPKTILLDRQSLNTPTPRYELVASFDGGDRWTKVYSGSFMYLGFTSPNQGVAIVHPNKGDNSLIITTNGGRNWKRVDF